MNFQSGGTRLGHRKHRQVPRSAHRGRGASHKAPKSLLEELTRQLRELRSENRQLLHRESLACRAAEAIKDHRDALLRVSLVRLLEDARLGLVERWVLRRVAKKMRLM